MAISTDPKVTIRQDEEGGAKVRASLSETERIQQRLNNAIKSANFRAAYAEAAKGSEDLKAAQERLAIATGKAQEALTDQEKIQRRLAESIKSARFEAEYRKAAAGSDELRAALRELEPATVAQAQAQAEVTTSSASMAGGLVVVANQALELAGKVAAAADAVYDFARSGAQASDIGARFASLGDAVPSLEALRMALMGAVDETSMQLYANTAESLGLTATESLRAAQSIAVLATNQGRAGDIGEFLTKTIKGSAESLRELGYAVDYSSEAYQGLSESEKKAQIVRELAAKSTELQADGVQDATLAYVQSETALADLVSNLQVFADELLRNSGALEAFKSIMATGKQMLAENRDTIERLVSVLARLAEMTGGQLLDSFERFVSVSGTLLDAAGPLLDITTFLAAGFSELQQGAIDTASAWLGLTSSSYSIASAYSDVLAKGKALAETQRDIVDGAKAMKAEFKLTDPATEETVRGWERAIRRGENLDMVIADIAAQSGNLEGAYADMARVGDILDLAMSDTAWTNLDKVIEGVEKSFKKTTKTAKSTKEELVSLAEQFERLDNLSVRLFAFSPSAYWEEHQKGIEQTKKDIEGLARSGATFGRRFEGIFDAIVDGSAEMADVLVKGQEAYTERQLKASEAQLKTDQARVQAALDVTRYIGAAAAEEMGGGWARAGFESMYEFGLAAATAVSNPAESASHISGGILLLAAQAFAEANGAQKGSSSSGGATRAPVQAAAGSSMLARPDSRTNGSGVGAITQLWFRNKMLGEAVAEDLGAVARAGGRKVPVAAVGGGTRRSF